MLNTKSKVNKKSKQMEAAILGAYDATAQMRNSRAADFLFTVFLRAAAAYIVPVKK